MNCDVKQFIYSHPKLIQLVLSIYNWMNPKNRLWAKGVKVTVGATLLKGLKIISTGADNEIVFGDFVRIKNCTIIIRGNRNRVTIGDGAILNRVELCMEDSGNEISIGNKTEIYGSAHLAAIEGTKILIGDNCLFSSDLHIRTGDSHSILNMDGKRINNSMDVVIEDHVWIGTKVTCLKGVRVMENSVVAATTTLCKRYGEKNAVIGGVPGRIIRTSVNWSHDRIVDEGDKI